VKLKKVCIVQARLGSRRLPEKVMKIINGKPMIYWLILRLIKVRIFDQIIIAIPQKKNIELFQYLKSIVLETGIKIYRGPEKNVLKRFYFAAKKYNASTITRVTADDPLKDINIVRNSLLRFIKLKLDYYSNTIIPTFPIGIDIEHFTFNTLKVAYKNAVTDFEKEHVTVFMKNRQDIFNIQNFKNNVDLSKFRLTVDTKKDFIKIKKIFVYFKKNPFISYKHILKYLTNNNDK
jgi:spore coat polysaccharide biosynthesis protein SpsF (cytidylyltransferase family)